MGRSLTQVVSSSVNLSPHLQAGTPKQLAVGEGRACYAICSYNTSSIGGGISWLDKFFQPVVPTPTDYSTGTGSGTNHQLVGDSTWQTWSQVFGNLAPTQSYPASNGTSNYGNATPAAGEFGNAMVDTFSNRTAIRQTTRNSSWTIKHSLNRSFVNSDHTDRSVVYVLNGNIFRAVSRIDGDHTYNRRNTREFTIPSMNTSMVGSASYNNVLKRLVILSYNAYGGSNALIVYNGIDFDKFPSPADAFANATRIDVAAFVMGVTWGTNDAETQYCLKPVLCDNGDIFVTVMHPSVHFAIYKIVLNAGLTAVSTTAFVTSHSLTTSYGAAQGIQYGQRQIQSRDGGAVLSFCPYYYYGAGIYCWLIDKRKSSYTNPSAFNAANSNYGFMPMPYGDDGFSCYYAGNYYASNPNGGYITGTLQRNSAGNFEQTGTNIYLPYAPPPNTTNYPFMTQVVDYSMLDNQNVI